MPKPGIPESELQSNLDYACGMTGIDCSPIQPGGPCFEPNTVASHAAYAMNILYQTAGRNPWNCDFSQTASLTSTNPSKFLLLILHQHFPTTPFEFLLIEHVSSCLVYWGLACILVFMYVYWYNLY